MCGRFASYKNLNKLKNILKRKLKLKKVKIFLSLSDEREYSVAYVITQKIK